jgi:signal transduction histidine kinase
MVFNNIISNAVHYRDARKNDSYISINIHVDATKATLRFSDNGIGIHEEYIDKIFKMFFRANADSKGSGLGLYIVKGVLEKLNGTINVQSKLGEGTTFVIEIPQLRLTE